MKKGLAILTGVLSACSLSAQSTSHAPIHADDYLQYLPAAAYMSLGFTGLGTHSFGERLAVCGAATAAGGTIAQTLKWTVDKERPDGSGFDSFPSGHSVKAFIGAELVRMEYGWGYGLGAYAVAAGVGYLRIYNEKHWDIDVLAGAGIGILSAHIGYWTLPFFKNLFNIPDKKALSAIPVYNPMTSSGGIALCLVF